MEKFKQISTDDLLSLLVHEHVKIIDIRSINAYNGWKLRNENRGGHINGARALPVNRINYKEWVDIARYKNINRTNCFDNLIENMKGLIKNL